MLTPKLLQSNLVGPAGQTSLGSKSNSKGHWRCAPTGVYISYNRRMCSPDRFCGDVECAYERLGAGVGRSPHVPLTRPARGGGAVIHSLNQLTVLGQTEMGQYQRTFSSGRAGGSGASPAAARRRGWRTRGEPPSLGGGQGGL